MAVLKADMDYLKAAIADLRSQVRDLSGSMAGRMDAVETWCTRSQERWAAHEREHERESFALKTFSAIGSAIAAVVASLIGVFAKN